MSIVKALNDWIDTVYLELIRHKYGSTVSVSKISEAITVQLFILDAMKLAELYNNSFE